MKGKIYDVIVSILLFWVISDLFSGIQVQDGLVGYIICGGIFGLTMLVVIPLIKFFTLPIKFITIFLIAIMLSVIVFFFLNFAIPAIDFTDGKLVGLSTSYLTIPSVNLSMIGNVFIGGALSGMLYATLKWLSREAHKE